MRISPGFFAELELFDRVVRAALENRVWRKRLFRLIAFYAGMGSFDCAALRSG
jgi:hypothetical protein